MRVLLTKYDNTSLIIINVPLMTSSLCQLLLVRLYHQSRTTRPRRHSSSLVFWPVCKNKSGTRACKCMWGNIQVASVCEETWRSWSISMRVTTLRQGEIPICMWESMHTTLLYRSNTIVVLPCRCLVSDSRLGVYTVNLCAFYFYRTFGKMTDFLQLHWSSTITINLSLSLHGVLHTAQV